MDQDQIIAASERDTLERERQFAQLKNRQDFIPGQREPEPLLDGLDDSA